MNISDSNNIDSDEDMFIPAPPPLMRTVGIYIPIQNQTLLDSQTEQINIDTSVLFPPQSYMTPPRVNRTLSPPPLRRYPRRYPSSLREPLSITTNRLDILNNNNNQSSGGGNNIFAAAEINDSASGELNIELPLPISETPQLEHSTSSTEVLEVVPENDDLWNENYENLQLDNNYVCYYQYNVDQN
jgi:hypothetical protein